MSNDSITYEKMIKALNDELNDMPSNPLGLGLPHVRFGMPVFERPAIPKIQLSENCPVSDEFRAKVNAWYIEVFGYKEDPMGKDFYIIHRYGISAPRGGAAMIRSCGT